MLERMYELYLVEPKLQNNLTLNVPCISESCIEIKIKLKIFISTFLCGASKGFLKALKAFIRPSEAPQRSVKIKITLFLFVRDWHRKGQVNTTLNAICFLRMAGF